jgi:hypothetical protein
MLADVPVPGALVDRVASPVVPLHSEPVAGLSTQAADGSGVAARQLVAIDAKAPPVKAPNLAKVAQSANAFAVVSDGGGPTGTRSGIARKEYDPWSAPLPIKAVPGRKPPGPPALMPPSGPGTGGSSSSTGSTGDGKQVPLQGWVPLDNGLGRTYWWDTISNVAAWDFPQRPARQPATVENVE